MKYKFAIEMHPHRRSLSARIIRFRNLGPAYLSFCASKDIHQNFLALKEAMESGMKAVFNLNSGVRLNRDCEYIFKCLKRDHIRQVLFVPKGDLNNPKNSKQIEEFLEAAKYARGKYKNRFSFFVKVYSDLDENVQKSENLIKLVSGINPEAITTNPIFDVDKFLEWKNKLEGNMGINCPLYAGVTIPTPSNLLKLNKFYGTNTDLYLKKFGISKIEEPFLRSQVSEEKRIEAMNETIKRVKKLKENGVSNFIFYTLNCEPETIKVLTELKK